jgi:NAD(P)-dependent dehydrogenase (short-subunit alcohol dehydrogenase family)
MKLRGKTALVTGGAVRIGRAIVESLAAEGCNVAIHCNRSLRAAETLARRIQGRGVDAWVIQCELAGEGDCERVMESVWRLAGRADILVNNAAVFHKDRLSGADEATLLSEWRVNLLVPILLTRAFARRARQGAVINLLDRRIAAVDPACLPYWLSKKALAAFTEAAAMELAPRITVNGVAPGPVLPPPGKGPAYLHDKAGCIPLGKSISPATVASAVVSLLKLDGVTGQTIFVDGGQHLLGNAV